MKYITQENANKQIIKPYYLDFFLDEDSLYLIEAIASAKSWWQNVKSGRAFFKDDDIFLYLDGKEITTSQNQKSDSRSVWNGNDLQGLDKTMIIAVYLKKGKHTVKFVPDQKPFLKSVGISRMDESDLDLLKYAPVDNSRAQNSEGRPWLSFAILSQHITKLTVVAKADKNGRDDDDIKLIINGEIQKNENKKAHQDWYWCGKISHGEERTFLKDINLKSAQYNIDLWSDGTPLLRSVEIEFKKSKRIPTADDPKWTGDFNDDTDEMILARAIFGEGRSLPDEGKIAIAWSIRNRVEDGRWSDNYHDVILQKSQYSAFRESDKNWEYVKNPLYKITPGQLASWKRCYEIAKLVISGGIKDPTGGVNHYFSDYIDYPSWTKSKNAKFIMKVDNTLFYNLKREGGGFIKIKYLLIFILLLSLGVMGFFLIKGAVFAGEAPAVVDSEEGKPCHLYINPQTSEIEKIIFQEDGRIIGIKQLTNNGYPKSHLFLYANEGPAFGYYQDLHKQNEDFDYNNEEERNRYYDNFTALMIDKNDGSEPFAVYKGNYHTSSWEWEDNNHVKVYLGCGTHCLYYYIININDLQVKEEGHVYTDDNSASM